MKIVSVVMPKKAFRHLLARTKEDKSKIFEYWIK